MTLSIFCDLDNTLIGPDYSISDINRQAINRFVDAGGNFIIATGRFPKSGIIAAEYLNIKTPCIYSNGAIIHSASDGILFSDSIDKKILLEVVQIAKAIDATIEIYTDMDYYTEKNNELTLWHRDTISFPHKKITPPIEMPLDDIFRNFDFLLKAVIISKSQQQTSQIWESLEQISDKIEISGAGHPDDERYFFNISKKGTHKGSAVQFFYDSLNIDPHTSYGIGDSHNDIELFKNVNYSFAVSGSDPLLHSYADKMVSSASNNGVAEAIQYILSIK